MFKTSKDIHPHVYLKIKEVPTQILPQSFDWSKHPSGPQGHPTTHPELEKRGSPQSKLICALKADPKNTQKKYESLLFEHMKPLEKLCANPYRSSVNCFWTKSPFDTRKKG